MWALSAQLGAGIGVVQIQNGRKPDQPKPYPRPDWVTPAEPKEVVVTRVADAVRLMKGGDTGGH